VGPEELGGNRLGGGDVGQADGFFCFPGRFSLRAGAALDLLER